MHTVVFFSTYNNTTSISMGWRVVGSYEVMDNGYVNTENNQIASTDAFSAPRIT